MSNQIKLLLNRISDAFLLNIPIAASILIHAITLPIILRNLAVQDYGLLQFVIALEVWLTIFTVPHISLGTKRGVARGLDGTLLFSYLVRLRLFLFLSVFVWVAAIILRQVGGFETLSILLFLFGVLLPLGVLTQATWRQFLIAKKKFRQYAFWRGIALILTPIAGMIAAIQTHNIIIFAVVQFGFSVALSIAALGYIIWKYHLVSAYQQGRIDREVVSYGVRMLPVSFAVSVSEKGAALLIGPFFGFANLAIFSVADKLTTFFKSFLGSSYSLFYADFAKLSWETLVKRMREHFLFGLLLAVLISLPFVAAGYLYIHFFLPESYQLVKFYLLIFGLGLPPSALKGVMQAMLESDFRTREILFVSIVPNLLRLSFFIVAGLLFGVIGIVWAIVLSAWIEYGFYYLVVVRSDKSNAHGYFDEDKKQRKSSIIAMNRGTQKNHLIILATYWNERYFIEPSLRQIEALNPCEILICDGCFDPGVFPNRSTDGTCEIIQKFVETHPNARLVSALRPGFFRSFWLLLRGHRHIPWWTILRPVRWKFLITSLIRVAYRRNQAITFNHMIGLSQEWKPGVWFMTYDADHFYSDETIEKIKEITSGDTNFDLITAKELRFFTSFDRYTTDYDPRRFPNMPHRIYRDTLIQPTRSLIRETKSGGYSILNFRKMLAKHLYAFFAESTDGGTYFHYKLNPPKRLKAGYQLGDRGKPNPANYKMEQFTGKHPRVIREHFGL